MGSRCAGQAEAREQERTGPARPIDIQSIEVVDGRVSLGAHSISVAAHVPTDFESLNASFSFVYVRCGGR